MVKPRPCEARATRIANALLRRDNVAALARAEAWRDVARDRNDGARSDLFIAAGAVISRRAEVIGRMKLPAGDGQ